MLNRLYELGQRRSMATTFHFDPDRVAYFEANGWRAYYDHKWLKMLGLIVGLCQEQFRIPFPVSLLTAYYTTRALLCLCIVLFIEPVGGVPVSACERQTTLTVIGFCQQ